MKKGGGGVSETFDEHEQDTAQRAYPKGIVEGTKLTTKMAAFDLDNALRGESGTRPAISTDTIERRVREHMEETFHSSMAASSAERISGPLVIGAAGTHEDADPHSRPTIDVVPKFEQAEQAAAPASPLVTSTPVMEMKPVPLPVPVPISSPPPSSSPSPARAVTRASDDVASSSSAHAYVRFSRQAFTFAIVGVVLLVAAAGSIGYFLGRKIH